MIKSSEFAQILPENGLKQDKIQCPVCESIGSFELVEEINGHIMLRCNNCLLEFDKSMKQEPFYYESHYYDATPAYKQFEKVSYRDYLQRGKKLFEDVKWQPYSIALKWIKDNLSQGDAVVDLGCGYGWFLAALEAGGFKGIGVEVSDKIVKMLKVKGFDVFYGPLVNCPEKFCRPKAITTFEVIEHISDPVGILKEAYNKFPCIPIIISVPNPQSWAVKMGIRSYCDYPPNHLTRWPEKSLKAALNSAGYREVDFIKSRIFAREVYAGFIIWLTYKLGLRRKGYFGETSHSTYVKNKRKFLNEFIRLVYPMLNVANKILAIILLPLAGIIAFLLNKQKIASFSYVAVGRP